MTLTTRSVDETLALGRLIGQLAPPPPQVICLALDGPLGAGKTHLTRGIAEGAGIDDPTLVSSPTYVLLNIYPGPKTVYHLDAYRVASAEDFQTAGLDDLLSPGGGGGIVIVEWAKRVAALLPADRLQIALQHEDDPMHEMRTLDITATGPRAASLLGQIETAWENR